MEKMGKKSSAKFVQEISHEDKTKKFMTTVANKRQRERGSNVGGPKSLAANYKAVTGGSAYQNGILFRIVEEMKSNFLRGEVYAISFDEILDKTSQTDINDSLKHWLKTDALPNNPSISVYDNLYVYKPPLNCWNKNSLVELFKKKDAEGPFGVLEDNVLLSVPYAHRVLQELEESGIIFSNIRGDKKKVYFYATKVKEEEKMPDAYKNFWKSVFIHGMDDAKIEMELFRNNMSSSNNAHIVEKVPILRPPRKSSTGGKVHIRDNAHIQDLLISYDV